MLRQLQTLTQSPQWCFRTTRNWCDDDDDKRNSKTGDIYINATASQSPCYSFLPILRLCRKMLSATAMHLFLIALLFTVTPARGWSLSTYDSGRCVPAFQQGPPIVSNDCAISVHTCYPAPHAGSFKFDRGVRPSPCLCHASPRTGPDCGGEDLDPGTGDGCVTGSFGSIWVRCFTPVIPPTPE